MRMILGLGEGHRTAEEPLPGRGVVPATAERLAGLYGARSADLIAAITEDPRLLEPVAPGSPVLRAEVWLAVQQEMACSLLDFMDRRSGLLLFGRDHGQDAAPGVAAAMADLLGWSPVELSAQVVAYLTAVSRHGVPTHPRNGSSAG